MSSAIMLGRAAADSILARPFAPQPQATLLLRQPAPRRTKLWEFASNLHCSIIGTCLSTAELRGVLKKCGLATQDCSEHDLHGLAVGLAARQDDACRQLHKALDHRHKLAINQFAKADTQDALRAMWRDFVRRGEIPSAYWATLTHSLATQPIVREAFGEVHMLSHLVGAANRADIRRLCLLEAAKAELEAKVERQQRALHDAITQRDGQIAALRQALAERCLAEAAAAPAADDAALRDLIADRERRLAAESRRRSALEARLTAMQAQRDIERTARIAAETACGALRDERAAAEAPCPAPAAGPAERLDGVSILYVGGRPNQIVHLRTAVEDLGGTWLHHDGGVEHHQTLLAGLVSRCGVAVFPVDCISHDAANLVKGLCRKAGKGYVPLRSASAASLLAALQTSVPLRLADATT